MAGVEPGASATMGRPKKDIDWEKFDVLCRHLPSQEDVAWQLDVSVDTLSRRVRKQHKMSFAEYMGKKKAGVKYNIFLKQYQMAMAGDKTMLIWLGKQLGQADKTENKTSLSASDIKEIRIGYEDEYDSPATNTPENSAPKAH